MSDERIDEQGEGLFHELEHERGAAGGPHGWRCSADLRRRVIAFAVTCVEQGESHTRIAKRLGIAQPTLSRWIREGATGDVGFRSVAIVPSAGTLATPLPSSLRLRTPRGFVVEGLDPELLASLLQVLG